MASTGDLQQASGGTGTFDVNNWDCADKTKHGGQKWYYAFKVY